FARRRFRRALRMTQRPFRFHWALAVRGEHGPREVERTADEDAAWTGFRGGGSDRGGDARIARRGEANAARGIRRVVSRPAIRFARDSDGADVGCLARERSQEL